MTLTKLIHTAASVMLLAVLAGETTAKSVYVVSDTGAYLGSDSYLCAYEIVGNGLVYQTQYKVVNNHAIGIAMDTRSAYLFVTFENENKIDLISAKTMQYVDTVTAPNASNLAGIVIDEGKSKVYAINRFTSCLYVYSWNAQTKKLLLDIPSPYYIRLQDCSWGCGLALDQENGRLYVGDNTNRIKYYNTNDWSKEGEIRASCNVIGVAFDADKQLLYYGSMGDYGQGDLNLYQYNLSSGSERSVNVGCSVAGIALDQQSSLVYLTTYGGWEDTIYPNPPEDRLMVYDSNLVKQQWESGDIGNPAGVCVPSNDVSYKPPFPYLVLTKGDNVVTCTEPCNRLCYNITYDANGYAGNNVVVTDYLPPEVDYYSSDPSGNYDPNLRTITWNIGGISGMDCNTLRIQVTVNYYAGPGGTIHNYCEVENKQYRCFAAVDTNVCWYGGDIIYVDKDARGYNNGTSWYDAYTKLQDALTCARNRRGAATAIWVAEGAYSPTEDIYDADANFALIEGVGLFGHFGGVGTYETSPDQRNFADVNNTTILDGRSGDHDAVKCVVTADGIEDAIVDGFVIRGGYYTGVFLDDANATIVNCELKENYYGVDIKNDSSPYIHNCLLIDNSGYGINCDSSRPVIANSTFDGNNITQSAIYANWSIVELTDCTVKNHTNYSVQIYNSDIGMEGCCIKNNTYCIYCSMSRLIINHSVIERNSYAGLACVSCSTLNLTNSVIRFNGNCGIYLQDMSSATIKNNWIHNNAGDYGYGIYFTGQTAQPLVRNNTIIKNRLYGIYAESGTEPDIANCILYYNGTQTGTNGGPLQNIKYSCIQDGNTNDHNINANPLFYDDLNDPNNLHLASNSPCIDKGDPNGNYDGETDIDGQGRIIDGDADGNDIVDMGADEYYRRPPDFSEDGIVNFTDYSMFAAAWRNSDSEFSLDGDSDVDYADLAMFCEDWLWQAGWTKTSIRHTSGGLTCGADRGMSQTTTPAFSREKTGTGEVCYLLFRQTGPSAVSSGPNCK